MRDLYLVLTSLRIVLASSLESKYVPLVCKWRSWSPLRCVYQIRVQRYQWEIVDNIILNNDQQAYPWPQLRGYPKNSDMYEHSLYHLIAGLIIDWNKSWKTAVQFMAGVEIAFLSAFFVCKETRIHCVCVFV